MTALDTQNGTISNPGSYQFTSSATNVVEVSQQGAAVGVGAGTGRIDISLSRGGVTKTAQVNVTVTGTLGLSANVAAGASNDFQPQVVAIARTGTVTWSFGTVQHNVQFNGVPGSPANIPNSSPNTTVSRQFNTAGNFPYDCNLHAGMVGTVIVR
jgi:plastocyanin